MTRLQHAAARLCAGSAALARRYGNAAADWVRAGQTRGGRVVRLALLAGAAWAAWRVVRALPALLYVAVPAWLIAAWRAAPAVPAEDADDETPALDPGEALHALLREGIGDRPGVHLATLLDTLQQQGAGEGWTVGDLRARLEAAGVPCRRSVKAGGRVAWGVHRDDLPGPAEAPSPADADEAAA
ncbi:MAG: hypothetical protein LC792_18240 [Actinobacteria bacterium]|nr:hypothetical protein [Actinomycetota bacterium]